MSEIEDVVVYGPIVDVKHTDWDRCTLAAATEFCRSPKEPALPHAQFVAVDDWGNGRVVAATSGMSSTLGMTWHAFRASLPLRSDAGGR